MISQFSVFDYQHLAATFPLPMKAVGVQLVFLTLILYFGLIIGSKNIKFTLPSFKNIQSEVWLV